VKELSNIENYTKDRYKDEITEKEEESNSVTLMKESSVSAETTELISSRLAQCRRRSLFEQQKQQWKVEAL